MADSAANAQKYLLVAHIGAGLCLGLIAAVAVGAPDFLIGFLVGCLLVLVATLFRSRMRDEYIERLWKSGTAAAFITALVMTVGADLVVGFADEQAEVFTVSAFSTAQVGLAVLTAFYLTFHLAMLKDRA